jgi:hypothetical protein
MKFRSNLNQHTCCCVGGDHAYELYDQPIFITDYLFIIRFTSQPMHYVNENSRKRIPIYLLEIRKIHYESCDLRYYLRFPVILLFVC